MELLAMWPLAFGLLVVGVVYWVERPPRTMEEMVQHEKTTEARGCFNALVLAAFFWSLALGLLLWVLFRT